MGAIDPTGLWQFTIGGAWGFGGIITFGYNGGRWNVGATAGIGVGGTVSFNPNDLGKNNMQSTAIKVGFKAQGQVDLGLLNGSVGASWTSEADKCNNYDNRLAVNGGLSLKPIEKGTPGFGKIGGEAGIRQYGNTDKGTMVITPYTKPEGYSYGVGGLGLVGVYVGGSW